MFVFYVLKHHLSSLEKLIILVMFKEKSIRTIYKPYEISNFSSLERLCFYVKTMHIVTRNV